MEIFTNQPAIIYILASLKFVVLMLNNSWSPLTAYFNSIHDGLFRVSQCWSPLVCSLYTYCSINITSDHKCCSGLNPIIAGVKRESVVLRVKEKDTEEFRLTRKIGYKIGFSKIKSKQKVRNSNKISWCNHKLIR